MRATNTSVSWGGSTQWPKDTGVPKVTWEAAEVLEPSQAS